MVESSEDGRGHELRQTRDIGRLVRNWRLATEPLMRTPGMIVALDQLAEEPLKIALAWRDDVIEKLAPESDDIWGLAIY